MIQYFGEGRVNELDPDGTVQEQAQLLPYDPAWEVNRRDIQLGKADGGFLGFGCWPSWECECVYTWAQGPQSYLYTYYHAGKQLGSGSFGRVVLASVRGLDDANDGETEAAVKMVKSHVDVTHLESLMVELKILSHLGKHINIVNMLGANTVHLNRGEGSFTSFILSCYIFLLYCQYDVSRFFLLLASMAARTNNIYLPVRDRPSSSKSQTFDHADRTVHQSNDKDNKPSDIAFRP